MSQPLILVLEYCARGSLADVLAKARANPALCRHLPWPRLINIALDAAKVCLPASHTSALSCRLERGSLRCPCMLFQAAPACAAS